MYFHVLILNLTTHILSAESEEEPDTDEKMAGEDEAMEDKPAPKAMNEEESLPEGTSIFSIVSCIMFCLCANIELLITIIPQSQKKKYLMPMIRWLRMKMKP